MHTHTHRIKGKKNTEQIVPQVIKGLYFRTILSLELLSLRLGESNMQLISLLKSQRTLLNAEYIMLSDYLCPCPF